MTNWEFWDSISKVMLQVEQQYNISVQNVDNVCFDFGKNSRHKIEFASHGFESLSVTHPNDIVDEIRMFGSLCSLGHEISHCRDRQNLFKMPFEQKLFYYVSDELSDYYHYRQLSSDGFYYNDYHEVNAELNGLYFAYRFISKEIGQNEAGRLLKTYVNEKLTDGIYYIPNKQYRTCQEILDAFEQKKIDSLSFNFSFPFVERVCTPLEEWYDDVQPGVDQLAVLAGRAFTARNYEQDDVILQYGKEFWNNIRCICNKYPQFSDYIVIAPLNDYGESVDDDLLEMGVSIPKSVQEIYDDVSLSNQVWGR